MEALVSIHNKNLLMKVFRHFFMFRILIFMDYVFLNFQRQLKLTKKQGIEIIHIV